MQVQGVCAGNRMAPSMNVARTRRERKPTVVSCPKKMGPGSQTSVFVFDDASAAPWVRE
jgi:hypothetical protein